MKTSNPPKRLYQAWKGKNVFLCGGRMILGPDAKSLLLTIFLIVGPSLAFWIQIVTNIINHKNHRLPSTQESNKILGHPVLIVAIIITILDLILLFLTSSRDPGILLRNVRPPDPEEPMDDNTPSTEWVNGRTHYILPRTKDVLVNGYIVKVKFCDTCLLYRLPRASHCSICNNCVQRFDHHCPWVGQCIGLRNYRFFFLFISASSFLCLYTFVISWLNIIGQKKYYGSLLKSMRGEILSVVLVIYTFVGMWFVGGLTVFHLYLILTNQTTYENFRYQYEKKENPYNRGIWKNIREIFFSRIPSSMCKLRSWVFEESLEVWSDISRSSSRNSSKRSKSSSSNKRSNSSSSSRRSNSSSSRRSNSSSSSSRKGKLSRMGSKQRSDDGSSPIPHILHDVDTNSVIDKSRCLNREIDPLNFPVIQDFQDNRPAISNWNGKEANGTSHNKMTEP